MGAAGGLGGGMTAASVTSRSVSLTPQAGGGMQAAFSMAGDATGEGLPAGCTYSVQGTASTDGGPSPPCVPTSPVYLMYPSSAAACSVSVLQGILRCTVRNSRHFARRL